MLRVLLLLHNLVGEGFAAFEGDAQGVGAGGEALRANALQTGGLRADEPSLKVEQLHPGGCHVRRVLHVEDIADGVGANTNNPILSTTLMLQSWHPCGMRL